MIVFIAHPGLQHSHQLALAFYEKHYTVFYLSGTPTISNEISYNIPLISKFLQRLKIVPIDKKHKKNIYWPQILLKFSIFLNLNKFIKDIDHRIFHLFDKVISRKILKLKPDIVVAYENSAYYMFKTAKRIGAICILDAPSIHFEQANHDLNIKSVGYRKKIDFRKSEEIRMADLILTCSPLAAKTYIDAGVEPNKVKSVLLGTNLPKLKKSSSTFSPLKTVVFIYAGSIIRRKSIAEMLSATNMLIKDGLDFKIKFVGGGDSQLIEKIKITQKTEYLGKLSQSKLFEQFELSDCILLPSKFDSFGMVVAEAMACGTPAIVSATTGSKAIIEKFPNAGWIIQNDTQSIYSAMKECIINKLNLFERAEDAKIAGQYFSWQRYRNEVIQTVEDSI